MKLIMMLVLLIPVGTAIAEEKKPAGKSAEAKKPLTVPPGAEEVEPNTYRHTDEQGKTWIYRKTPFGLVKFEEKEEGNKKKDAETPAATPIKVTEDIDKIRFERQGPFGPYRWVRKKGELTTEEREAWERSRQKKVGEKAAGQE